MPVATEAPTTPIDGEEYVVATESSGLVRVEHASHGLLTIDPNQTDFTDVQRTALKAMGIETEGPDAVPVPNVLLFLHQCQVMLLDPYLKQAYLITHGKIKTGRNGQRYDNRKFTFVIGIDGFRRRGALAGSDDFSGLTEPEWAGEDERWHKMWSKKWAADDAEWGQPLAARVGIRKRHDPDHPTYGVAMYDEYVPLVDEYADVLDPKTGKRIWDNEQGRYKSEATGRKIPTEMWIKMPANQCAKCAEARAWRMGYPDTFSGVYVREEMERAHVEYEEERRRAAEVESAQRARRAVAVAKPARRAAEPGEPVEGTVVGHRPDDPAPPQRKAKRTVQAQAEVAEPATDDGPPLTVEERDALLRREVAAICTMLGKPVSWVVDPKVKMFGEPYDEWDIDRLQAFVVNNARPWAIGKMRQDSTGYPDEYARVPVDRPVTNLDEVGLPEPAVDLT